MLGLAVGVTAIGYGWFDVGLPEKNKATLRWCGPIILVGFAVLLLATFLR